jgi:hypothetical protein
VSGDALLMALTCCGGFSLRHGVRTSIRSRAAAPHWLAHGRSAPWQG